MISEKILATLNKCVTEIRKHTDIVPETVIVLGSGLNGIFKDEFASEYTAPYERFVDFALKTHVVGHENKLSIGTLGGKKVLLLNGRFHLYEGYSGDESVFFIRLARKLGAKNILLTNAAGGLNMTFNAGDIVVIDDQISLFVKSALVGENIDEIGTRFPDMGEIYDKRLKDLLLSVAEENNISVRRGVYAQLYGPQYETPAEVHVLKAIGADVVGMSTATEAIAARHAGLTVAGISCVTNVAGKQEDGSELSQEEVEMIAAKRWSDLRKLIIEAVKNF